MRIATRYRNRIAICVLIVSGGVGDKGAAGFIRTLCRPSPAFRDSWTGVGQALHLSLVPRYLLWMAALQGKYEEFCKLVADGKEPIVASQLAGFSGSVGSDGILYGPMGEDVRNRINELLTERGSGVMPESVVRLLDRSDNFDEIEQTPVEELNRHWVLSQMKSTYVDARRTGNLKSAVEALRQIGMDQGMFVQRREVTLKKLTEYSTDDLKKMLLDLTPEEYSVETDQALLPKPPEDGE